jgi:hypothetical protein
VATRYCERKERKEKRDSDIDNSCIARKLGGGAVLFIEDEEKQRIRCLVSSD